MVFVVRFAEDFAIAFNDRIAGEDKAAFDSPGNVVGLLAGESRHQFSRGLPAPGARLRSIGRQNHLECVAGRLKQLPPTRRVNSQFHY